MKTLLALLVAALLAATLMACPVDNTPVTQSDAGPVTVPDSGTATLSGGPLAFTVNSAFEVHNVDNSGGLTGFSFVLTDSGKGCADLEALHGGPVLAYYRQVYGGVVRQSSGDGPTPGTYQVGGATSATQFVAFVYYNEHYPDGGATPAQQAVSGTVTLDAASASAISGNFQVVIPDANGAQGPLQGTFGVPYCP